MKSKRGRLPIALPPWPRRGVATAWMRDTARVDDLENNLGSKRARVSKRSTVVNHHGKYRAAGGTLDRVPKVAAVWDAYVPTFSRCMSTVGCGECDKVR